MILTRSNAAKSVLVASMLALVAGIAPAAFAGGGGGFALPTSEVLGYIAICFAFVSAVGGAILGLIYLARAFKWGRKAG